MYCINKQAYAHITPLRNMVALNMLAAGTEVMSMQCVTKIIHQHCDKVCCKLKSRSSSFLCVKETPVVFAITVLLLLECTKICVGWGFAPDSIREGNSIPNSLFMGTFQEKGIVRRGWKGNSTMVVGNRQLCLPVIAFCWLLKAAKWPNSDCVVRTVYQCTVVLTRCRC